MRSQERPTAGSEHDAGPEYRPSDAELGVGEADPEAAAGEAAAPAEGGLAAVLERPEVKAAIDGLVAARVKELAGETPAAAVPGGADMATLLAGFAAAIASEIGKVTLATAAQQPGHVKPLPLEEVEARAAAYVEMTALIERAAQEQSRPTYLLTEDFHAADVLWAKGDTILWYGPPNTEMEPQNPPARAIFAQMMRWIGGEAPPHISDQVADAVRGHRAGAVSLPDDRFADRSMGEVYRNPSQIKMAERVEVPRREVGPGRQAGTVVPEGPAAVTGGPLRQPYNPKRPQVGSVMPAEGPSAAQHF